jgi:hypothetical protein
VGGSPSFVAAQQATRTIPIVFVNVADPVGQGFIASLATDEAADHLERFPAELNRGFPIVCE